ncbi:MAG: 50S ribosomal protein L9 [Elusimicrobiota bacterium]|nr:50S ribosomal protein L9 [Elusimicrobiota bacterium]
MKVILKEDVKKLGSFGEVVDVKDGYARNYLLPRGLVWPDSEGSRSRIEELKHKIEITKEKEKEAAGEMAEKLKDVSVTVEVEVGEDEKLFGSVTNIDIAEKLKGEGIDIDKKDIIIKEPIKELGVYKVKIDLHPEVKASCKVWVVKK